MTNCIWKEPFIYGCGLQKYGEANGLSPTEYVNEAFNLQSTPQKQLNYIVVRKVMTSLPSQDLLVFYLSRSKTGAPLKLRMRCAIQARPDQSDLGRARGANCDRSTESGSTIYGLESLIRTPFRVCTIWLEHYLRSEQSDMRLVQSLDSLIIAWWGLGSV